MLPICFSQIIGNEKIKEQLNCMLSKKAIGHALLFAGPDGIGKSLFAWALAARIMAEYGGGKEHGKKLQLGQHPDVHVYRPEGKLGLHSIQAMRQLSEEVYYPPYEAFWKVFIIHDAERMLSYSANALLKTFEEPPPRTLIILLTHSKSALIPTIISRCSTLHFESLSENMIRDYLKDHCGQEEAGASKIARLAQGSLGRALRIARQGDDIRLALLNLLSEGAIRNYKAFREAIQNLGEHVESVRKQVEEQAQEELFKVPTDQMSPQQRSALEKELEGISSLALAQESQALFEHILSWHRDLHLLLLGSPLSYLMNPDFRDELEQAVQRGGLKPLDQVHQAAEEASVALQRSIPFTNSLETFILKIQPLPDYVQN